MKKFQFSLATVLKIREREEKQAQQELAEAYRELEAVVEKISRLKTEHETIEQEQRRLQLKGKNIEAITEYVYYLQALRERIAMQQDIMLRLRNVVENKRQALTLARQKVKTLENLRENQYAKWEEEYRRLEKIFLDEVAVQRYSSAKVKDVT